jgi:succinate dehydrogenase flavin-adding protein (antitoxin of CptAB toxin-antitoxin module)
MLKTLFPRRVNRRLFSTRFVESEDIQRRKRILYSSRRRGRVENELFFGSYASEKIWDMPVHELDQFEVLLEETDYDLYNWVLDLRPTPPEFQGEFFDKIREYIRSKKYDQNKRIEKTYDYDYENTDCCPPEKK